MTSIYAHLQRFLHIFLIVTPLLLLGACAGGYGTPWGAAGNTGVVTNDPNSLPDIGWQTNKQRQELIREGREAAKQETVTEVKSDDTTPVAAAAPARKASVSILLPLSGKRAEMGQSMLKAAQMALFDVGASNFNLVPRDTKSTTEGAAEAAKAAVDANTDLILGPIFADDVKAVKAVTGASGIPVIAFTTDWTLADSNTYIMGFLPFAQVARVARYAQSKGFNRIAALAPQTEYADVVVRTLQGSGVSVSMVNRYSPEQPDLSTIIKDFADRAKSDSSKNGFDFDALMLAAGGEGLKTVVTYLNVAKVTQPDIKFLGTGLWDEAGVMNDPSLFGGWYAAPDPNLRADFERRYQDNYGVMPVRLSSLAYDATALAAVAARSTEGDASPYSRSVLTNPRGFAGIDGIFRFRPDGLSERGLAILEIRSGRKVVVDKAPTAFFGPRQLMDIHILKKEIPDTVTLIAVSKFQPVEKIMPLLEQGHRHFGENRVQEAVEKFLPLKNQYADITLHMVGHLQSNKAKQAVEIFDCLHCIDRASLAAAVAHEMEKQKRNLPCFIQINTGDEAQKGGVAVSEFENLLHICRDDFKMNIVGLMCIPPINDPPEKHFSLLSDLAKAHALTQLSMGMSADYKAAIRMGATHVRIGSLLFGQRPV